jgi:hypothetical protein
MISIKRTARLAGLFYVLMSILSVYGFLFVPATFYVTGDAAATARRITEGELVYRIGIASALVGQVLFLFVVLTLYHLFKDVDRRQARIMLVLVCVGVAAEVVNIANRIAPLVFLSGAAFLDVFTKPQLDALAFGYLRMGGQLGRLITVFWGLWLFPFGILTIKSGFFPRILGYLLMIAGVGYVVTCLTNIVCPALLDVVSRFMMPLYFGELPIVFWLLIMGAREPRMQRSEAG